jgi:uncharacterized membrane protein YdjX (TVP38/TMEM64 family)
MFVSQIFWDMESYINTDLIKEFLSSSGGFAPLIYMIAMASAIIISPIPSLPLNIAAGALFGPFLGTAYSVIGALGGAVVSFVIARRLGRQVIERFTKGHVDFCTDCSDRLLTKIVFLSRLLPFISFDVVSYGAGLTKMSLRKFAVATFLGMIPLTFIYNYFGSVLVFSKGLTLILGFLLVMLFFLIPIWLERKKMLGKFAVIHKNDKKIKRD